MNLNIDPEWLLRMAEEEANGIISVGGLVTRLAAEPDGQTDPQPNQERPAVSEPEDNLGTLADDALKAEFGRLRAAAYALNDRLVAVLDEMARRADRKAATPAEPPAMIREPNRDPWVMAVRVYPTNATPGVPESLIPEMTAAGFEWDECDRTFYAYRSDPDGTPYT